MSTPAEIHARRNAVDPVNPENSLRPSESLCRALVNIDQLRGRINTDFKRAATLVHDADKHAFTELLKVASQALESAGNIIDCERERIEMEVAK